LDLDLGFRGRTHFGLSLPFNVGSFLGPESVRPSRQRAGLDRRSG
jgi:hypothetical protein